MAALSKTQRAENNKRGCREQSRDLDNELRRKTQKDVSIKPSTKHTAEPKRESSKSNLRTTKLAKKGADHADSRPAFRKGRTSRAQQIDRPASAKNKNKIRLVQAIPWSPRPAHRSQPPAPSPRKHRQPRPRRSALSRQQRQ